MKPRVLFTVTSDPRTSPRPAEAVRIAAGVGAWEKVEVTLYLHDAAVLALGETAEELVDGEHFIRYLPLLTGRARPIYVQRGAPLFDGLELGRDGVPFEPIEEKRLAELAASSQYVVRF